MILFLSDLQRRFKQWKFKSSFRKSQWANPTKTKNDGDRLVWWFWAQAWRLFFKNFMFILWHWYFFWGLLMIIALIKQYFFTLACKWYYTYFTDARPPLSVARIAKYCNHPRGEPSGEEGNFLSSLMFKLINFRFCVVKGCCWVSVINY